MNSERVVRIFEGQTAITVSHLRGVCVDENNRKIEYIHLQKFVYKHLTVFDFDTGNKRFVPKDRHCRIESNYLHIPKHFLLKLKAFISGFGVTVRVIRKDPWVAKPLFNLNSIDIKLRDNQVKPAKFLSGYTDGMSALMLGCGGGKTVLSIDAVCNHNLRSIVTCPANLMDQWVERIKQFYPNARVIRIAGRESIESIIADDFTTNFDVIVSSVTTMGYYAKDSESYQGLMKFSNFMRRLQLGTRITDEVHLNFLTTSIIDTCCNIKNNIYLSATYGRSNKYSKAIFLASFPISIRRNEDNIKNYINITSLAYTNTRGPIKKWFYATNRGYNQTRYEDFILARYDVFKRTFDAIREAIDVFYYSKRKEGQKCFVLVGRVSFAERVASMLQVIYKDLKCNHFVGETKESVLHESDIVISTFGSLGTGKDIKKVKTLILFADRCNDNDMEQSLGRLRELPDDTPEFVYMTNLNVDTHKTHCKIKTNFYKPRSLSFNEYLVK